MGRKAPPPTDKQLRYAKDLGVKPPKSASREEVSDLIDLAKGERDFGPMFRRFHDLCEHDGYVLIVCKIKQKFFAEFAIVQQIYEEKNTAWVEVEFHKPKKMGDITLLEEYKHVDVSLDNVYWHEAISDKATFVSEHPKYYKACEKRLHDAAKKISKGKTVHSPKSDVQSIKNKKSVKRGFRAWVRRKLTQLLIAFILALAALIAIAIAS